MEKLKLEEHIGSMTVLSEQIEGHLTIEDVKFLSILPLVEGSGEILEIGSFKGKSTVVLTKSAIVAGRPGIHACDPLTLPADSDPELVLNENVAEQFYSTLEKNGIAGNVSFYQINSCDLARQWNLPLRVLWIDGDHTYGGALSDFEAFHLFLEPGAVVAMHDVLNDYDGPKRVFLERIVLSSSFGDCGFCGSIGWGQFLGKKTADSSQWARKLMIYKQLSRLIPFNIAITHGIPINKFIYKTCRKLVKKPEIRPREWLAAINKQSL